MVVFKPTFRRFTSGLFLSFCVLVALTGCDRGGPTGSNEEAKTFTPDEFDQLIAQEKLVLLKFGAPWCGPCRQVDQELEAIKPDLPGDVEIVQIDVDANPELASDLQINGIPRLMLLRNSELVADKTGYMSREALVTWIDAHR